MEKKDVPAETPTKDRKRKRAPSVANHGGDGEAEAPDLVPDLKRLRTSSAEKNLGLTNLPELPSEVWERVCQNLEPTDLISAASAGLGPSLLPCVARCFLRTRVTRIRVSVMFPESGGYKAIIYLCSQSSLRSFYNITLDAFQYPPLTRIWTADGKTVVPYRSSGLLRNWGIRDGDHFWLDPSPPPPFLPLLSQANDPLEDIRLSLGRMIRSNQPTGVDDGPYLSWGLRAKRKRQPASPPTIAERGAEFSLPHSLGPETKRPRTSPPAAVRAATAAEYDLTVLPPLPSEVWCHICSYLTSTDLTAVTLAGSCPEWLWHAARETFHRSGKPCVISYEIYSPSTGFCGMHSLKVTAIDGVTDLYAAIRKQLRWAGVDEGQGPLRVELDRVVKGRSNLLCETSGASLAGWGMRPWDCLTVRIQ